MRATSFTWLMPVLFALGCPSPGGSTSDSTGSSSSGFTPASSTATAGTSSTESGSSAVSSAVSASSSRAPSGSSGPLAPSSTGDSSGSSASSTSISATSQATSASNCEGETRACYPGPTGTEGIGPCHAGTTRLAQDCAPGPCEGAVVPSTEIPDGLDNDCDGVADRFGMAEGTPVVIGQGSLPRLLASANGFIAVYATSPTGITLQPLDVNGAASGAAVQQATTATVTVLDAAIGNGGVLLAWSEGPAHDAFSRRFDAALHPLEMPEPLGSPHTQPEEFHVVPLGETGRFAFLGRWYSTHLGTVPQRYGTVVASAVLPIGNGGRALDDLWAVRHGSSPLGSQTMVSLVGTRAGAVAVRGSISQDFGVFARVVDVAGAPSADLDVAAPLGFSPVATWDGTRAMLVATWSVGVAPPGENHWYAAFVDEPHRSIIQPPEQPRLGTISGCAASNGVFVGPWHVLLAEDLEGNLHTVAFDALGIARPTVPLVQRSSGPCLGQCARIATTSEATAVLFVDGTTLRFQRVLTRALCTPGEPTCDGDSVRTCNAEGTGFTGPGTFCARSNGLTCDHGACIPRECTTGPICRSNAVFECSPEGLATRTESCSASEPCWLGQCGLGECTIPGLRFCMDDVAITCGADRHPDITTREDCTAQGKFCGDGACHPCLPYASRCVGDAIITCAPSGDTWAEQPDATCSPSEACVVDRFGAQCVEARCAPGAAYCEDSGAALCNLSGTGPELTPLDCPASLARCEDGACVPLRFAAGFDDGTRQGFAGSQVGPAQTVSVASPGANGTSHALEVRSGTTAGPLYGGASVDLAGSAGPGFQPARVTFHVRCDGGSAARCNLDLLSGPEGSPASNRIARIHVAGGHVFASGVDTGLTVLPEAWHQVVVTLDWAGTYSVAVDGRAAGLSQPFESAAPSLQRISVFHASPNAVGAWDAFRAE